MKLNEIANKNYDEADRLLDIAQRRLEDLNRVLDNRPRSMNTTRIDDLVQGIRGLVSRARAELAK